MLEAYLYDGVRTPFGRHGGALASVRPDDLLAAAIRPLVGRLPFPAGEIEDVIVGCANQAGEDSRCVARHAALLAGLPVEVPGTVVQRNCGSGLGALGIAARSVSSGEVGLVLSGGVESMSRAPFVVGKAERAFERRLTWYDSAVGTRFPNPAITARHGDPTMPETADTLAAEHGVTREQADAFALRSQDLWARAQADGVFADEVVPVAVPGRRGAAGRMVQTDEQPRPESTAEGLARLAPIHAGGVTTPGNAPSINDGAAALVIGSRAAGERAGMAPRARILASAAAGVPPRIMGWGPVPASEKALALAGLSIADMDVIEMNEAFAAQAIACLTGLGVAPDDPRVNPHGGAIAVGHPLGASGPRLALTALNRLERTGGRHALLSMCVGVGQGISVVMERLG
jgi:acetyl-CoA C-acetyltransferase